MHPTVRTFVLSALLLACSPLAGAADWPHLRGPDTDGRLPGADLIPDGPVGLAPAFRVPLGSGYSGVVVAGDRAVTMFSTADGDQVGAFDAATGKPLWRFRLGDRTVGHDGSHDGPLSSPVLGNGSAYALGSDGRLVALQLEDGSLLWEKSMERDFGASRPHFGFTTSPLFSDGVVVVQAGGAPGRFLIGIDARTGDMTWSHGEDQVEYQSPAILTLAGRRQIVAVGSSRLVGLEVSTGDLLWAHPLEEGDRTGASTPTALGDDRFAVPISGEFRVYRATRSAEVPGVEELYRTAALGETYAPPVYHDGHLYGFRGQILTCVNAENGERVWRSREPGGDGLILVGDNLVILAARGHVVIAAATPEGYVERARLQALEGSGLTWPSFAGERIYVRNLEELAAVRVTASASAVTAAAETGAETEFGRWLATVASAERPQAMVEERFRGIGRTPLVEGEYVHFVYRDAAAADVGLAGSMNDTDGLEPLQRVQGTDLFYLTRRLPESRHWEYRFQVDFAEWKTDPLNPDTSPAVEGEGTLSVVQPEGPRSIPFLEEPTGPRGRFEELRFDSKALGWEKTVRVWLPPDYPRGKDRYRLLLVNDSEAWTDRAGLVEALDNLVGRSIEPVVVAFVDANRRWWLEAGGTRTDDYVEMLITELLPRLKKRYRLSGEPGAHAIVGHRYYGFTSAYAALLHPQIFGRAAMQSVYLGLGLRDQLMERIGSGDPGAVAFYLDWNRYDERNVDRDWDLARDSRELDRALRGRGFRVTGGEVEDSYGWNAWSGRLDALLAAVVPLPAAGE